MKQDAQRNQQNLQTNPQINQINPLEKPTAFVDLDLEEREN